MIGELPERGTDRHGSGHFGASRGSRTHRGVDLACYPGTKIRSTVCGKVTKLGWPYRDRPEFRYVQITDARGLDHRYFYVEPSVEVGQEVTSYTVIGTSQELPYEGITQHVHYEVKSGSEYLDPTILRNTS